MNAELRFHDDTSPNIMGLFEHLIAESLLCSHPQTARLRCTTWLEVETAQRQSGSSVRARLLLWAVHGAPRQPTLSGSGGSRWHLVGTNLQLMTIQFWLVVSKYWDKAPVTILLVFTVAALEGLNQLKFSGRPCFASWPILQHVKNIRHQTRVGKMIRKNSLAYSAFLDLISKHTKDVT